MSKVLADRLAKWGRPVASGCVLWTGATSNDYGLMKVDGYMRRAHRVAWVLKNGAIPKGLFVLHKCDAPGCINTDHLFLGTQAENMADCTAKNRQAVGERLPFSKLTDAKVRAIRGASASDGELALRFGVSQPTINRIRNRQRWKHVQ